MPFSNRVLTQIVNVKHDYPINGANSTALSIRRLLRYNMAKAPMKYVTLNLQWRQADISFEEWCERIGFPFVSERKLQEGITAEKGRTEEERHRFLESCLRESEGDG